MNGTPHWLVRALSIGRGRSRFDVLLNHRVAETAYPLMAGLSGAGFQWQLEVLSRHFNILPLAEAVRRQREGTLPPRAACVSFDDGFADTLEVALPIAHKVGVPITVFIATRYLNGGLMFNDMIGEALHRTRHDKLDLRGLGLGSEVLDLAGTLASQAAFEHLLGEVKYRPVEERLAIAQEISARADVEPPRDLMLDDDGVRALRARGVEIGGHTHSHPMLALCNDDEARREIEEGKSRLEGILDEPVRLFAYPNGQPGRDYGPRDVALVREAGFEAAFSTGEAPGTQGRDPFQLPRFTPWDKQEWRFVFRLLRGGRAR